MFSFNPKDQEKPSRFSNALSRSSAERESDSPQGRGVSTQPATVPRWPYPLAEPLRVPPLLIDASGQLTQQALFSVQQLHPFHEHTRTLLLHLMPSMEVKHFAGAQTLLLLNFFKAVVQQVQDKDLNQQLEDASSNYLKLRSQCLSLKNWFALEPDGLFTLPFFWYRSTASGHAMMCNIFREKDNDTYCFELFNVGQSSGRMVLNTASGESLVASAIRVREIREEKIFSPAFIESLEKLMRDTMPHADLFVYDHLVNFLEGKISIERQSLSFAKTQMIGNCSWASLWLWAAAYLKHAGKNQAYIDHLHLNVRAFALLLHYCSVFPTSVLASDRRHLRGQPDVDQDSDFETPQQLAVTKAPAVNTASTAPTPSKYLLKRHSKPSLKARLKTILTPHEPPPALVEKERNVHVLLGATYEMMRFSRSCGIQERALVQALIGTVRQAADTYLEEHLPPLPQHQKKKSGHKLSKFTYTPPSTFTHAARSLASQSLQSTQPIHLPQRLAQGHEHNQAFKILLGRIRTGSHKLMEQLSHRDEGAMSQVVAHDLSRQYAMLAQDFASLTDLLAKQSQAFRELATFVSISSQPLFRQLGSGEVLHDLDVRRALHWAQRQGTGLLPAGHMVAGSHYAKGIVRWGYRVLPQNTPELNKELAQKLCLANLRQDSAQNMLWSLYGLSRNISVLLSYPHLDIHTQISQAHSFFQATHVGGNTYSLSWNNLSTREWQLESSIPSHAATCFKMGALVNQHGIFAGRAGDQAPQNLVLLAKLRCHHPIPKTLESSNLTRLLGPIEAVALMAAHPATLSSSHAASEFLQRVILEETLLEQLPQHARDSLAHGLGQLQERLLKEGAFY